MRFVKRFIKIYILTFILLFVFLSLGGWQIFDMRHYFFVPLLVCTFVAAVIVFIFVSQQEKIEQLEERIEALEEKNR